MKKFAILLLFVFMYLDTDLDNNYILMDSDGGIVSLLSSKTHFGALTEAYKKYPLKAIAIDFKCPSCGKYVLVNGVLK